MMIRQSNIEKWRQFLATFDHRNHSTQLWKVIKALDNKIQSRNNQPIKFRRKGKKKRTLTSPQDIASKFNKLFTSTSTHQTSKDYLAITRAIQKRSLSDSPTFTASQVSLAIKKANSSKAAGPDGHTMIHLKHLGPRALQFLTELFEVSDTSHL